MRDRTANLKIRSRDLKTLREALCVAQSEAWRMPFRAEKLGAVIDEIDRHRPLGSNGKHGRLHTRTCGCEDKPGWVKRMKRRITKRRNRPRGQTNG